MEKPSECHVYEDLQRDSKGTEAGELTVRKTHEVSLMDTAESDHSCARILIVESTARCRIAGIYEHNSNHNISVTSEFANETQKPFSFQQRTVISS